MSVVSLGFVNQGAIYLWLLHDFSHLQPFVCSSGWHAARICRWTGKIYFANIAKYILHALQNVYCKHCKMYIANIAKYVFTTGISFTIFEWFENYIMYSCSNFFYCQNVGSNSHFFVLCTSCTLHECLADLLYKRQGGKGSLVAHLSNCEVLPPTK